MYERLETEVDELRRLCAAHGVARLQVFGSAAGPSFDAAKSDLDLFVDFSDEIDDTFEAYFGLKEDLEKLFERPVDLVMTSAVVNPHFAAVAFEQAVELYAA